MEPKIKKRLGIVGAALGVSGLIAGLIYNINKSTYGERVNAPYSPVISHVPTFGSNYLTASPGDFDGDGDLDLMVGTRRNDDLRPNSDFYLFLNDGKGNFTPSSPANYSR